MSNKFQLCLKLYQECSVEGLSIKKGYEVVNFLNDEQDVNTMWEAYPADDSSDPYDWVLDSIMAASPIDQPAPIDIVVEPVAQSDD